MVSEMLFWPARCMHSIEVPLKLILLVDDSKFQRLANERMLTKAGYEVVKAADGEEALRIACSRSPDLVILDMLLPKVSGPDVLKTLKSSALTSGIPVIVLSSLAQTNESKLLKEGAVAYLEKSLLDLNNDRQALVKVVSRTLGEECSKQDSFRTAAASYDSTKTASGESVLQEQKKL
jgi:CheY-like chemotaxis protein